MCEPIVPWTGWGFTDANNNSPCPKCLSKPGKPCRTPKGRKTKVPHIERLIEFSKLYPDYSANIHKVAK